MRLIAIAALIILSVLSISGCASTNLVSAHIRQQSMAQGNVFRELTTDQPVKGFSVLIIRAEIKTVKDNFYLIESGSSPDGRSTYPFVFNIAGHGIVWMAKGTPDTEPEIANQKRNPEGGKGMKYVLNKIIALNPGFHKIYIGLSREEFEKEVTIKLQEGKTNILEFKPVYFPGNYNRNTGSFYRGLCDFKVFYNGREITDMSN